MINNIRNRKKFKEILRQDTELKDWQMEVVKHCLNSVKDINYQNYKGQSMLHKIMSFDGKEANKLIASFLFHQADVELQDAKGNTPLHLLNKIEDNNIIVKMLEKAEDLTIKNNLGDTPLHLACAANNITLIKQLVSHGADVNALNNSGIAPVHYAAASSVEAIKALALQDTELGSKTACGESALIMAAKANKADVAAHLLNKNQDVNAKDVEGITSLHIAVAQGNMQIVQLLLEHGANDKALDDYGEGMLHYAAKHNHSIMIDLFIKRGLDADLQGKYGSTPLNIASDHANLDVVEQLLRHTKHPSQVDSRGQGPIKHAIENSNIGAAKLMIQSHLSLHDNDKLGETVFDALKSIHGNEQREIIELLLKSCPNVKVEHEVNQLISKLKGNGYKMSDKAWDAFETMIALASKEYHNMIEDSDFIVDNIEGRPSESHQKVHDALSSYLQSLALEAEVSESLRELLSELSDDNTHQGDVQSAEHGV